VKAGHAVKNLVFGWQVRQSDLIGCDGPLLEWTEALDYD